MNEYKTKDLAEASALLAKGQNLIRFQKEGSIYWFVFQDSSERQDIVNSFWFGECLVNARIYYQSMIVLKNRIFS